MIKETKPIPIITVMKPGIEIAASPPSAPLTLRVNV
jgi:hypothetical protein